MKVSNEIESDRRMFPWKRLQYNQSLREVLRAYPVLSIECRADFNDVYQENQESAGFETFLKTSISIDRKLGRNDADRTSRCALNVNDICKMYGPCEASALLPLERWTTMAINDECFPLLAKISIQGAELTNERQSLSSSPIARQLGYNDEVFEVNITGGKEATSTGFAADADIKVNGAAISQHRQIPFHGGHTVRKSCCRKRSGVVAKPFRDRQHSRYALNEPHLLAMPD